MIDSANEKKHRTILVVDDSRSDLTRARLLLAKNSLWNVNTAHDGTAALEAVTNQTPDLIVTDLQMPHMNGLELMQAVHARHPGIPVVVMTARGSEKIAMECLRGGAASYVPKSELARDLSDTVDRLLSRARKNLERSRLLKHLQILEYEIGNELSLIQALTHEIYDLITHRQDFPEGVCLRISTAVDEALTNAYYHGNLEVSSRLREEDSHRFYDLAEERRQTDPYRHRRINVKVELSDADVCITIEDEGQGFDPSSLPDPTEEGFIDRPHGRGILLMKTFMDEVEFNPTGNEVRLVKRVKG
jgi:CheY-like chemotaxis protein